MSPELAAFPQVPAFNSRSLDAQPLAVLLAICCCLTAASGQPFPSFLLDTMPRVGPAVEEATQPVFAFADSVGLLIWRDHDDGHIRGCRLTRDLEVLDSVMLDITGGVNNGESYHRFDVAASDHNFLVVWLDGGWYDVRGALVSFDGTVTARFTVDNDPELHDGTAIDFDGENFLVAWWQQDAVWFCTRYARVTTSGAVLDDPPWQLPGDGYEASVDVGFGDSLHLMTYYSGEGSDTEGVYGRLVQRDGSPVGDPALICTGQTWTDGYVEFNGEVFTVTLSRILGDSCEVRVYPVSLDGAVLDTAGVLIERDDCVRECALSWRGDTGLVAWIPGHDIDTTTGIYARRLDRSFTVLDTGRIQVSATYYGQRFQGPNGPAVAGSTGGFGVAYSYLQGHGYRDMVYRRVSPGGQVLDTVDRMASFAASRASLICTATDGRDFFAVWVDEFPDGSTSGIYGSRFSPVGEILQPHSIRLSQPGCTQPDIAFADGVYLVLWRNDVDTSASDLQAVRVGKDGTLLDSVPISIPDDIVYSAAVAGGRDIFLVVWQHRADSIWGARITADGVLLDTVPLHLARAVYGNEVVPVAASDGDSIFLVVFRGRSGTREGLATLRVGASGAALDTGAVILGAYGDYSAPSVAFGAGRFMVVDPGTNKGWFITPDGAKVDTIAGYLGWWSPRVVFDSANFLVCEALYPDTILGVRVTPDGVILDPYGVPLVILDREESYFVSTIDAAADSLGVVGLAFCSFEPGRFMSSRPRAAAFRRIAVGIDDATGAMPLHRAMQSVVGRVLYEPDHPQNMSCSLLDACGRKVMDLRPGANDVRALAPGVYFVREAQAQAQAQAVRKIVLTE